MNTTPGSREYDKFTNLLAAATAIVAGTGLLAIAILLKVAL